MIFSLLAVRDVSLEFHTVPSPPRAQWPRLFGTLGKMFLTTMKFDMWKGERRKRAVGAQYSFTSVFSRDYICYP